VDFFATFSNQKPAEVLLFLPLFLPACKKEVQDFNSGVFAFFILFIKFIWRRYPKMFDFKPGFSWQRFRRQLERQKQIRRMWN